MIRSQGFLLTVILSGLGYLASPFTFSGLMIFVPHSKHKVMMKHVFFNKQRNNKYDLQLF